LPVPCGWRVHQLEIGKSSRGKGLTMQPLVPYKVRWHSYGIIILDWFLVSSRHDIRMVGAVATKGQ
jgi:hypothetical protein